MKTLETTPRNADAALSTPTELDLVAMVEACAKRKATIGTSFSSKRGKASLFSACCAFYRSAKGLPKFNDDGKPAHLPERVVAEIEQAIVQFWQAQAQDILGFGKIVSYRKNQPIVKIDDEGRVNAKYGAILKAERECADVSDYHRAVGDKLRNAKKRLDYMLDNPAKFERDDLANQKWQIDCLENALKAEEIPNNP